MALTLSEGFIRRKKLQADFDTWTVRLTQAGSEKREFRTKAIEGEDAFVPETGSEKETHRQYTVQECQEKIAALLKEDAEMAQRISRANQRARAAVVDLEGVSRELTIPELLVLKNEVIPKLEQAARAIPVRSDGVNVIEEADGYIRHRAIRKLQRQKESITDKGLKIEEVILEAFDVTETTDFGLRQRDIWNEVDRIQEYAERVKQAINEANKTEIVEL